MMTNMTTDAGELAALRRTYPDLDVASAGLIIAVACRAEVPAGSPLFSADTPCHGVMWLLEGSARVFQRSSDGREVTLYRVHPGELCLLSLYTLFHGAPYEAEARAETPLRGLVVTANDMLGLLDRSDSLRRYLLKDLTARLHTLVSLAGDTALQRLDLRLACLLGGLFERSGGAPLNVTHEAIAHELGTSREVVSRLLKQFEQQGCIWLGRGRIELADAKGLARFRDDG